jgi:hypothetical protein
MDGHKMSWMRSPVPWIAALATLVIVPAARADSPWDDPGRSYDRYGSWNPYDRYDAGYWPASDPYPEFDSLRGHGRWSRVAGFHDPVWFPYVAASWRPYFYGHWVNTRFGMTWVSYEPWGDIPHHYGHWVYVDHYGWGWVPGWEYGPAWVTWGVVDGYIGWAPLPPAGYRYPRSCRYSPGRHHPDYRWSASFAYDSSGLDFGLWVFVQDRHFYGSSVHSHAIPAGNTLSLFKEKRVLPVGRDLHVDYVKRVSPEPVRTVELTQRTRTTGGKALVFQEPRGQESKIREGREVTKAVVRAPVAPSRPEVAGGKSRGGEISRPEAVGEKPRSAAPSRPEAVGEKSRSAAPSRPEAVTEKRSEAATKETRSEKEREQKVEKRKR